MSERRRKFQWIETQKRNGLKGDISAPLGMRLRGLSLRKLHILPNHYETAAKMKFVSGHLGLAVEQRPYVSISRKERKGRKVVEKQPNYLTFCSVCNISPNG